MSYPIRKCKGCGVFVYRDYPMNLTGNYSCDILNVPHEFEDVDETKTDYWTQEMIRQSNKVSDP